MPGSHWTGFTTHFWKVAEGEDLSSQLSSYATLWVSGGIVFTNHALYLPSTSIVFTNHPPVSTQHYPALYLPSSQHYYCLDQSAPCIYPADQCLDQSSPALPAAVWASARVAGRPLPPPGRLPHGAAPHPARLHGPGAGGQAGLAGGHGDTDTARHKHQEGQVSES